MQMSRERTYWFRILWQGTLPFDQHRMLTCGELLFFNKNWLFAGLCRLGFRPTEIGSTVCPVYVYTTCSLPFDIKMINESNQMVHIE